MVEPVIDPKSYLLEIHCNAMGLTQPAYNAAT